MSAAPDPDLPGDLLSLAREDLAAAEALDRAERVSDAPVGFHAQQAVEKALKSAIAGRDSDFPFTHDIGLLMQLCQDAGLELPGDLAEADRLTRRLFVMASAIPVQCRLRMPCDGRR